MKRRKQKAVPWHQPHEPIPGEIEARLTKPIESAPLFQVWVEQVHKNGAPLRVGPMGSKEFCEKFVIAINLMIAQGKERLWGNPHIVPA